MAGQVDRLVAKLLERAKADPVMRQDAAEFLAREKTKRPTVGFIAGTTAPPACSTLATQDRRWPMMSIW